MKDVSFDSIVFMPLPLFCMFLSFLIIYVWNCHVCYPLSSNCHNKATFLTPEEAQTYLSQLRLKKKSKDQLKPPTNLVAAELNDWYSQQRRIQLEEQKKRMEAVGVMLY